VDKFQEAAEKFRHKKPEDLRWGTRIEEPGVMDLIQTDEVIDRLLQVVKQEPPEHLKH
jgi:heptosyltransferase I